MSKRALRLWGAILLAAAVITYCFLLDSQGNGIASPQALDTPAQGHGGLVNSGKVRGTDALATPYALHETPPSDAELRALQSWLLDRGYPEEKPEHDGELKPIASDYDAMSDSVLRQLASQEDRKAQLLLAKRLLIQPARAMSEKDYAEAARLLNQASINGYTSSLILLSQLSFDRARIAKDADKDLLASAYQYAYMAELRGDPGARVQLDVMTTLEKLNEHELQAAKNKAQLMIATITADRRAKGLPPLSNGMPQDLMRTYQAVLLQNS